MNLWLRLYLSHKLDLIKRNSPSDIVSDLTETVSGCTLGVHYSLGDSLASEVGKLVEQVEVLHEQRSAWTGSERVLVVVEGISRRGGDSFLFHLN
jgi:hypothetical protein